MVTYWIKPLPCTYPDPIWTLVLCSCRGHLRSKPENRRSPLYSFPSSCKMNARWLISGIPTEVTRPDPSTKDMGIHVLTQNSKHHNYICDVCRCFSSAWTTMQILALKCQFHSYLNFSAYFLLYPLHQKLLYSKEN